MVGVRWCALAAVAAGFGAMKVNSPLKTCGLKVGGGVNIGQDGDTGSMLQFGKSGYHVGVDAGGAMSLGTDDGKLSFLATDQAIKIKGNLAAAKLDVQSLTVGGRGQWQLLHMEDFENSHAGWDLQGGINFQGGPVSMCGGVSMLGGFKKFSQTTAKKAFGNLPPHKKVRVKANFHFIDNWGGETGYMQANVGTNAEMAHVWTERHSQQQEKNGLNICGSASVNEGKFSVPIDVTLPHESSELLLQFGSTLDYDDAADRSWGISALQIFLQPK